MIGPLATPSCPYCRQRMTVLLPFFTVEEQNDADLNAAAQRKTLYENIRAYNRLFSGINKISSMYTLLESI